MGWNGEGSELGVHIQREVWLERHSKYCHPGDGRHLFLGGDEKAGV